MEDRLRLVGDEGDVNVDVPDPLPRPHRDLELILAGLDDLPVVDGDVSPAMSGQQAREQAIERLTLSLQLRQSRRRQFHLDGDLFRRIAHGVLAREKGDVIHDYMNPLRWSAPRSNNHAGTPFAGDESIALSFPVAKDSSPMRPLPLTACAAASLLACALAAPADSTNKPDDLPAFELEMLQEFAQGRHQRSK
jgi:hypothetical protein